jgi:F0F1-type ATP synthase alpha subunit
MMNITNAKISIKVFTSRILNSIKEKKQLDDDTKRELKAALEEFKAIFKPTAKK